MHVKTYLFMDCETTGVPCYENNKTKLTEICFVAVNRSNLEKQFPRVLNKLSLCFSPQKLIHPESTEITGLDNFMLENQKSFSDSTTQLLNDFMEHLEEPICMIAHNGNRFDYPILQTHLNSTRRVLFPDLLCIDSLLAFRQILPKLVTIEDEIMTSNIPNKVEAISTYFPMKVQILNETTPKKRKLPVSIDSTDAPISRKKLQFSQNGPISHKLGDIHTFLHGEKPEQTHFAENDVLTMMKCCLHDKVKKLFLLYVDDNAVLFNTVPSMTPGTKCGD